MRIVTLALRKGLAFLCLLAAGAALFSLYRLAFPLFSFPGREMLYNGIFFTLILAILFFLPVKVWAQTLVDRVLCGRKYPHFTPPGKLVKEDHIAIAPEQARLYEAEKVRRQETEQLERERGVFLSAITHELRTPITSMKLVTDLLAEETRYSEMASHQKLMANLQRSLQSLQARVDDLVEFARLQNPEVKMETEPVALDSVVSAAVDLCQPLFNRKQQNLAVEVPADLPFVRADPFRLELIITNLLVNASKYTPPGSRARIRARLIEPAPPREVVVEVEDDGAAGIAPEHLESVFKPYFTTSAHKGMGLGLAIVKRLVDLHGGRIRVASQPGKTVFSFTLPVAR